MSNRIYIVFSDWRDTSGWRGSEKELEKIFYSGDNAEAFCISEENAFPLREYWFEEHEVV